jgi:hypothetical protein
MEWAVCGEVGSMCKILVGKPEGKRSLKRFRHRWEDNIRVDFKEIGLEGVDWIHLTQDGFWWGALVNTVMNFWIA